MTSDSVEGRRHEAAIPAWSCRRGQWHRLRYEHSRLVEISFDDLVPALAELRHALKVAGPGRHSAGDHMRRMRTPFAGQREYVLVCPNNFCGTGSKSAVQYLRYSCSRSLVVGAEK
jgi:hypothetical protein